MAKRNLIVQEWLKRAADDEANVRSLLKHRDGSPAGVCFLAQQMAEKCLKALIVDRTGDAPKIHDLIRLVNLASLESKAAPAEITEVAVTLRPYYIATRYPADIPFEYFNWEIAQEAFEAGKWKRSGEGIRLNGLF